jgi:hypothetical protein
LATIKDKIYYRSGYKYQLAKTYSIKIDILDRDIETDYIKLNVDGVLTIKKGYAWDGPSGPTIDTHTFMRGSLVHDALYQLIREGYLDHEHRLYADELIRDICIQDGMWLFRANYTYDALHKYADYAANPKNKKKIKEAPRG